MTDILKIERKQNTLVILQVDDTNEEYLIDPAMSVHRMATTYTTALLQFLERTYERKVKYLIIEMSFNPKIEPSHAKSVPSIIEIDLPDIKQITDEIRRMFHAPWLYPFADAFSRQVGSRMTFIGSHTRIELD